MGQIKAFFAVLLMLANVSALSEPSVNGFYVGTQAGWERLAVGSIYRDEGWGGGVYVGLGKMIDKGYAALELEVNQSGGFGLLKKQTSFGGHALLGVATDSSIWYLRVGGMSTRFEIGVLGTRLRGWDSSATGGLGVMIPLFKPVSVRLEYLHKWYLDTGSIDVDEDIVRIGLTYHL